MFQISITPYRCVKELLKIAHLEYGPGSYVTIKMCKRAVKDRPWSQKCVSDQLEALRYAKNLPRKVNY